MKNSCGSRQSNFFSGNRKEFVSKLLKGTCIIVAGAILLPFLALVFVGMGMFYPPISLEKMLWGNAKAQPGEK